MYFYTPTFYITIYEEEIFLELKTNLQGWSSDEAEVVAVSFEVADTFLCGILSNLTFQKVKVKSSKADEEEEEGAGEE